LELAEDIGRRSDVALLFLDVRKYPCDAGALDFDEDLSVVSKVYVRMVRCASPFPQSQSAASR
jgi:hypothetical protein